MNIPVAQPLLSKKVKKYVNDCIDSNWISSIGSYIERFEEEFAKFCGVKHAISTNNGTTALHLSLVGLGVGPGDEVIIPTVTYIATANAVRYCGAVPVLADVEPTTLNIDPNDIEHRITPRTRGIIPVHLYGHPADMAAIREIADRHGLWVLEDAAEAHGAKFDGVRVGALGNCAAFSFFGNKIITTGEGGMITTNDDELAKTLRLYRGQGMDPSKRYWFPVVGYNYRMTNIQAAIGLAQLEAAEEALVERRQIARWYDDALRSLERSILLPRHHQWAEPVMWLYSIFLCDGSEHRRDAVMMRIRELGVDTRPVFYPMHVLPPYHEDRPYPIADTWACRGISLPTYQGLTEENVHRIARALSESLKES